MRRIPYLLMLLLLLAQVDDAWAAAPILETVPLAEDNDEYLPVQLLLSPKQSRAHQPQFVGVERPAADQPPAGRGIPRQRNLSTPFAPPPLHVLMSLQI